MEFIEGYVEKHVNAIVELHMLSMPPSPMKRAGRLILNKLYQTMFSCEGTFAFMEYKEDRLLAVLIGTNDLFLIRNTLKKAFTLKEKCKIAVNTMLHFKEVIHLFESRFIIPRVLRNIGVNAELLAWMSDTTTKESSFAALKCMNKSKKYLFENGHDHCIAQMWKTQIVPCQYYETTGGKLEFEMFVNRIYSVDCSK